jgi:hypothetical protein
MPFVDGASVLPSIVGGRVMHLVQISADEISIPEIVAGGRGLRRASL